MSSNIGFVGYEKVGGLSLYRTQAVGTIPCFHLKFDALSENGPLSVLTITLILVLSLHL